MTTDTKELLETLDKVGNPDAEDAAAAIRSLIQERDAEQELRTMQMVAICTASRQNTETSVKERITKSNPYWSPAYEDVCIAIDREISERKAREAMQRFVDGSQSLEKLKGLLEYVLEQAERATAAEAKLAKYENKAD